LNFSASIKKVSRANQFSSFAQSWQAQKIQQTKYSKNESEIMSLWIVSMTIAIFGAIGGLFNAIIIRPLQKLRSLPYRGFQTSYNF